MNTAQKNTLILGCFLWVSCSGGENQTNYQQFSSSANHSPLKKFYWTQQFRNMAWIQRVKILLLSSYFLELTKKHAILLIKTWGWRRRKGRKTNKYIETGCSEVGAPAPVIYYTFCQSEYWKAISSSGRTLKNIPILYHTPTLFSPVPCKCAAFLRKHILKDRHRT